MHSVQFLLSWDKNDKVGTDLKLKDEKVALLQEHDEEHPYVCELDSEWHSIAFSIYNTSATCACGLTLIFQKHAFMKMESAQKLIQYTMHIPPTSTFFGNIMPYYEKAYRC